eukprot:COSAG06_NODE_1339_length_9813_cov_44.214639_4_plen_168_part_00
MNVLVFILRCIVSTQFQLWVKNTFGVIPVRLTALKISERWCDCGMDKRSICQGRLGTDKQFETIGQWQFRTHQAAECVALMFNFELKLIEKHCVAFILNITMRRCAVRARAQPLPLYLSTMLYMRVRPPSFLSRSLSPFARAPPPPPAVRKLPPPPAEHAPIRPFSA